MYIQELTIENFRCFGNGASSLKLPLQLGLNTLVGENDSGKTAIIDSLRMLLGTRDQDIIRPTIDDFHLSKQGQQAHEFSLTAIFSKLSTSESAKFAEYLTYKTEDENHPVSLRLTFKATLHNEKIRSTIFSGFPTGSNGLKEIDHETLENLRATYLRPLRDAEKEMNAGKGSRISKILKKQAAIDDGDKTVDFTELADKKFIDVVDNLGVVGIARLVNQLLEKQTAVNTTRDNLNENFLEPLQMLGDELRAQLGISSNTDDETLKRQMLEKIGISLENTKGKRGLGSNNLLYIACEMLLLADSENQLAMLIIEEPEAHLHPQRQLKLIQYLQQKLEEDCELQIILSTHSPTLASKLPIKCMTLVHKGTVMPLVNTPAGEEDFIFLERFIDATKSNLFFCRGLMIVEGDAENLLMPSLSKLIGYDFTESGVSLVNVGHTGLSRYANLFSGNDTHPNPGIKVACLHDLDLIPYIAARELQLESVKGKEDLHSLWNKAIQDINNAATPDFKELNTLLPKSIISTLKDNTYDSEKEKSVQRKYHGNFVKGFYSGPWTLEYSLAFHGLAREVTISACLAKAEKSKRYDISEQDKIILAADEYFNFLQNSFTDKTILAAKIYELFLNPVSISDSITHKYSDLILKAKASKAAAGQHLGILLENKNAEMTRSGKSKAECISFWKEALPKPVVEAIIHVTPYTTEMDKNDD